MGRFSRLETGQPATTRASRATKEPLAEHPAQIEAADDDVSRNLDLPGCMEKADAAFMRGDSRLALRWYSRAMTRDSASIEPWVGLLHALLLRGSLSEAATWVNRGLTLFPEAPQLLALRAVLYARRGMMRQAMNNSDAVIERNASLPLAHMARGEVLVLAENKNFDFCFEQCVKLTPAHDWKTPMMIGMILEERRLWAKAVAWLAKAAQRRENEAVIWYRVGLCRAQLGHTLQAQKALEQAAELCPPDNPLSQKIQSARPGSILHRIMNLFRKT